jgi:cytochrome d ubiquinol oxidase subunit I
MNEVDPALLARLQFAFTISAHIIFPAFTIGLASYLTVLNGLWLWRGDSVYRALFDYWKNIFALVFGMGVASGIVMSYQFGTNWSVFSTKAGPIIGPLLGYEVLSAFFLEAGFLGIMLFGRARVGPRLHFVATFLVAFGTLLSAFWILSANSWMQTPAGYAIDAQGRFIATSWWDVVFNPSFPYRFAHMVMACYLTTAFVVGATGAWHLLRGQGGREARVMFSMAMWMATIVAPIQIVAGDLHGLNTLDHQPAKVAAMEGHFETQAGAPLILFGVPNVTAGRTDYAIEIPLLGGLILTHSFDKEVKGLNAFAPDARPNPTVPFFAFRVMVGLGLMMAGLGFWSLWRRRGRKLYDDRALLWSAAAMGPSGFAALLAGWFVTEVGRQPFLVYGVMRTAEGVSPLGGASVAASLTAFVLVYALVFGAGTLYALGLMAKPPQRFDPDAEEPDLSVSLAPHELTGKGAR